MKKITLALLAICMVLSFTLTSCDKGGGGGDNQKALKELVQGKTWKLGSVKKGATDVTSDFTGFQISFNADATSGQIISGGTNSETKSVTYNVGTTTITYTGTPPTGWAATLTEASANQEGTTFTFKVNINNPKTGAADYVFSLVP